MSLPQKAKEFLSIDPTTGALSVNANKPQSEMLMCNKRRVVFVAGTRAGKTASGVFWLYLQMRKMGPGDYMVVAPTMSVLAKGAEREITKIFERYLGLGYFRSYPRRFIISPQGAQKLFAGTPWAKDIQNMVIPTTIYLIHASDPNALEAITAKACWADEAGQDDFKVESYEAIERRLSIDLGPMLITTTPYNLQWLKRRLVDPWKKFQREGQEHPIIEVIQAKSIDNPAFPVEEYWRQKEEMPFWRWDMMYNGNFSVPSGLVYDCVPELDEGAEISQNPESEGIENIHNEDFMEGLRVKPFPIPSNWLIHSGIDFGGTNTAALLAALDPHTGHIYVYDAYYPGCQKYVQEHARCIRQLGMVVRAAGGAGGEDNWRQEYSKHGLPIEKPSISEVNAGIARVYGLFKSGRLHIFDGANNPALERLWEELYSYRYETDPETGHPLPEMKIVDKNSFHMADCLRYLGSMFPIGQGQHVRSMSLDKMNARAKAKGQTVEGKIVSMTETLATSSKRQLGKTMGVPLQVGRSISKRLGR